MTEEATPWRDLGPRLISAAVMIALTLLALAGGPVSWVVFVFAVHAVMVWELAALCDPRVPSGHRLALAAMPLLYPIIGVGFILLSDAALASGETITGRMPASLFGGGYYGSVAGLMAPALAGLVLLDEGRLLWFVYATILAGASMFVIYDYSAYGVFGLLTLVAIVVTSDTAGYFAGRAFGGPKFWPAISPKKTWSGTVAGWACAGLVGVIMLPRFGVALVPAAVVAVLLCFAAQMGDIAESAMKRRAGVKDASALIPGHGGVLDRLDGLVGAACLAGLLLLLIGI